MNLQVYKDIFQNNHQNKMTEEENRYELFYEQLKSIVKGSYF